MSTEHPDGSSKPEDANQLQSTENPHENQPQDVPAVVQQPEGVVAQGDAANDGGQKEHETKHNRPHLGSRLLDGLRKNESVFDLLLTTVLVVATVVGAVLNHRAIKAANRSAAAAEKAAKLAEESFNFAKAGEKTTAAVAEATKRTADAATATAAATTAAIELSRQANEAAAAANQISARANVTAQQTAEAARVTADATKAYASWTAFATEKQLRAYVSVEGISMSFDPTSQIAKATISLRNNGFTFAHSARPTAYIYCHPKGGWERPGEAKKSAPSIGPNGYFNIVLEKTWEGNIGDMESWVEGVVNYTDEFGRERYTRFKFIPGSAEPGIAHQYRMLYAPDGNDAN
jgi:hypothetical protein